MTTRTNLIVNPSAEVNATGWESNSAFGGYDVATVARSTAQAWVGTASIQVTTPSPVAARTWTNFTATPVTVGQVYTFSAYVRSATAATFYADAVFMEKGAGVAVPANTWTRVSVTFVASSADAFCGVGIDGAAAGLVYYVDGAILERGGSLGAYFDGDTADTVDITYAWTGTAHASTSTEVSPDPVSTDPLSAMEVLRLEVEADPEPGQLVNLVVNPSGELGGYGWNTPIPGSFLNGFFSTTDDRFVLQYVGAINAGGSSFQTENMPMSAGQYVAARWHYLTSQSGAYRARLTFLNASGSILSHTAYTSISSAVAGTDVNIGPYLAPANTVFVRLMIEVGDPGGVYPIAIQQAAIRFTDVTVAVAATSAELGTTRTNVITNPSAETNTTGWSAVQGTMTRAAAPSPAVAGSWAFRLVKTAAGAGLYLSETATGASGHVVSAGQTWRARAQVRLGATIPIGSIVAFRAWWFTSSGAAGTPTASIFGQTTVEATDVWISQSATIQVPTGVSRMQLQVYVIGPGGNTAVPTNSVMFVDAVSLEREGPNATSYFDGSTAAAGGWTYAWTGTAHNSTSVATNSNLGFVEPVPYNDVLGDLRELSVTREELNVGTLSAVVVNPDLSPVVAETLRPGRRFRLMMNPNPDAMLMSFGNYTESLIVGKLGNARVEYRPLENDPRRKAIISLTGVDPIALLANAKRSSTVGTVPELPYVLEGAGVPWRCDGESGQVASANVVVTNDSASALDQVAITRDTAGGYAWVDRRGLLRVNSIMPGVELGTVTNGSMNAPLDLQVWTAAFASDLVITASPAPALDGTCLMGTPLGNNSQFIFMQGNPAFQSSRIRVSGGQEIEARAWVRSNVSRLATLYFGFFDQDGNLISFLFNETGMATATPVGSWQERTRSFTVPPGAYYMSVQVAIIHATGASLPNTDRHYLDSVSISTPDALLTDLDETVYNHNFVVDYDTDRAINSVEVHRQWTHPAEGPQETVYGPYTDAASVSEWGTKHASVTVAGTDPSAIPALAAAILAKNATPEVRVQSLQIPINRNTLQYATLDLYDLVHVTNESVGIDAHLRIVGITHSVVANPNPAEDDRWLMTLDFASENGVATPTAAPALPSSTADSMLFVDLAKNGSAMSVPNSTGTTPSGWEIRSNVGGGTLAGASKVITTPGMHFVSGTVTFVAGTSGRRLLAIRVNGVDVAREEVATGSLITLQASNIVFANAGEVIDMQVLQTSGAALNIDPDPNRSHFTVYRLGS